MKLLRLLLRKCSFFAAVLFGVSCAILALSRAVPGDAIDQITDSPEQRAVFEAAMGLDQPLATQVVHWWQKALVLDFGESWVLRQGERVSVLLAPAVRKTALVVLPALGLTFFLATVLIALFRFDGLVWLKRLLRSAAHSISVIPLFLLGYLVIAGLNVPVYHWIEAGVLERPEWFALPGEETWHKYMLAVLVLAVGNGTLSDVLIQLESEVTHLRKQEFILSARARGASFWRHFLPNVLVPVMTVFVNKAGFFLGGVVIVEYVFNINGMGMLVWNAANQRDVPIVTAIAFLMGALVVFLHLVSDLVQLAVDPRLRREEQA